MSGRTSFDALLRFGLPVVMMAAGIGLVVNLDAVRRGGGPDNFIPAAHRPVEPRTDNQAQRDAARIITIVEQVDRDVRIERIAGVALFLFGTALLIYNIRRRPHTHSFPE